VSDYLIISTPSTLLTDLAISWGAIENESCATGGIHQRRVRTASGSDRILRATQHKHLFRKLLFDPVATARGSDTIRGDLSHLITPISWRSLIQCCKTGIQVT